MFYFILCNKKVKIKEAINPVNEYGLNLKKISNNNFGSYINDFYVTQLF